VHIVDGSTRDPVGDLQAVNAELSLFSPWLAKKPQVVVVNKIDLPHVRDKLKFLLGRIADEAGHKRILPISAATREQVPILMKRLRALLTSPQLEASPPTPAETVVDLDCPEVAAATCSVDPVEPGVWLISGDRIERAAAMTNWDYHEAQERFQRIMKALGVSDELKKSGAQNGDLIMVGDVDFKYYEESSMAIRARLAGFSDEEESDGLSELAQREIDAELAALLEGEGEVTRY
jgi:GTP-binding protein